jgi:site-specific DNA recombinase
VVAVVDQDRLTRSEDLAERGEILGAFQKAGVKIAVSMTGQVLDLNSSTGDLISTLLSFFAAEDNRKRRERTVSGKLRAIREGRKPAGPTPFGLLFSREKGWSLDPELAPIVVEVFTRVADSETCEAIARDLHSRGTPRARPSRSGKRARGRWNRERVWQIVRNPVYRGEWTADKARGLTVRVPAIVSEGLWNRADAALRRHGRRGQKRTLHDYLIQGLAVCALCGARIGCASTQSGARDRKKLWYYVCNRRRRPEPGAQGCPLPMLRAEHIDARIWEGVADMLGQPRYVEAAIKRKQETSADADTWSDDLAEAEAKLQRFDERCEKMADRYRRGLIADPVFDRHLEQAKRDRAMLERQVEAARAGIDRATEHKAEVTALLEAVATMRHRLKNADFKTRRELLTTLVPGTGEHVVRLGPEDIDMKVVIGPDPGRLPTFAAG